MNPHLNPYGYQEIFPLDLAALNLSRQEYDEIYLAGLLKSQSWA